MILRTLMIVAAFLIAPPVNLLGQSEIQDLLSLKIRRSYPVGASLAEWQETLSFAARRSEFNDVAKTLQAMSREMEPTLVVDDRIGEEVSPKQLEAYVNQNKKILDETLIEIGPELAIRCIQANNIQYLIAESRSKNYFDPSFLSIPRFREKMKLTRKQIEDVRSIELEQEIATKKAMDESFVEIRRLNRAKMDEFKKILSDEQTRLVDYLIGHPVNWQRLNTALNENLNQRIGECSNSNPDKTGFAFRMPTNKKLDIVLVKNLKTIRDFEDNQIDYFNIMLFSLLSSEFFTDQVDISEEQGSKIDVFLSKTAANSVLTGRFAPTRFSELIEGQAEYPANIEEILLPQQLDWLRQTELQFFTGKNRSTFGLLHPRMVKRLRITRNQEQGLSKIASEFDEKMKPLSDKIQATLAELGVDFARKKIRLLTDEDKMRFVRLVGWDCSQLGELSNKISLQENNRRKEKPKVFHVQRRAPF